MEDPYYSIATTDVDAFSIARSDCFVELACIGSHRSEVYGGQIRKSTISLLATTTQARQQTRRFSILTVCRLSKL